MAGRDYTTTGLLAAIRAEGSIPDEDPEATDAKLLLLADRIHDRVFVPKVRKAVSDYYTTSDYLTVEAGVGEYRIPHRAVTSSVRAVVLVDSSGREQELSPIPLADRHTYSTGTSGRPSFYCIVDDMVVLLPRPNTSDLELRIVYEYRPSKLVLVADVAIISAIALVTSADGLDVYQVGASSGFNPTDETACDVVCAQAPFSVIARDGVFDGSIPVLGKALSISDHCRAPLVGDYICPLGETPVPQLPAELHGLFALYCAGWYLKPTDPGTSQTLIDAAESASNDALALLSPRQVGKQMKMRPTASMMRRGRRGGGFSDWRP